MQLVKLLSFILIGKSIKEMVVKCKFDTTVFLTASPGRKHMVPVRKRYMEIVKNERLTSRRIANGRDS